MRICFFTIMAIAGFALCFGDVASAQGGRGRGPGQGGGRGDDMSGLLRNEAIQGEIELVDDQRDEIEQLQEEMWAEMRETMSSVRDLAPEERRERFAELREEMEVRRKDYAEKIEAVLLPQQLKRLQELQMQSRARRTGQGVIGLLENEEIMEELGIDDKKKEQLEKKAEEVIEALQKKIRKLRAEAEDEILSVLSSDQRRKFREKVGESFDFGDVGGAFGGGRGRTGGRGGADLGGPGGRGGRGGADQDSDN